MKILLSVVLAAASLLAQAAPMRYTFYDCGAYADCVTEPPTVLTQFTTPGVIKAPAVPPAGTITPPREVDVDDELAGMFDALGMVTFNTNASVGSLFVFYDLLAANGREVGPVMAIGAAFTQALKLDWIEGSYLGLARVDCYNVDCTRQTPIRGFVKLLAEIDVGPPATVPEPGALALAALALGLGLAARATRVARA